MSFGDGNMIDGKLYVTAYNINSGGRPLQSQVLVYTVPGMKLLHIHDIGGGVAESVTKHDNDFWVTYYDKMIIGRFDHAFKHKEDYNVSEAKGEFGGYQGAYWEGEYIFMQMHGPNHLGLNPSKGLDKYRFDGDTFMFEGTQKPLDYGTGQGVAVQYGYLLQNDRPENGVVIQKKFPE